MPPFFNKRTSKKALARKEVDAAPALPPKYAWQRKPIFKAVLLARQEELRKADLRELRLQAEWGALLQQLDQGLRAEHAPQTPLKEDQNYTAEGAGKDAGLKRKPFRSFSFKSSSKEVKRGEVNGSRASSRSFSGSTLKTSSAAATPTLPPPAPPAKGRTVVPGPASSSMSSSDVSYDSDVNDSNDGGRDSGTSSRRNSNNSPATTGGSIPSPLPSMSRGSGSGASSAFTLTADATLPARGILAPQSRGIAHRTVQTSPPSPPKNTIIINTTGAAGNSASPVETKVAVAGACSALVATGIGGATGQWMALVVGCLLGLWLLQHCFWPGGSSTTTSVDVTARLSETVGSTGFDSPTLNSHTDRKRLVFGGGSGSAKSAGKERKADKEEVFDRFNPLTKLWEKKGDAEAEVTRKKAVPAGLAISNNGSSSSSSRSKGESRDAEAAASFYTPPTQRKEFAQSTTNATRGLKVQEQEDEDAEEEEEFSDAALPSAAMVEEQQRPGVEHAAAATLGPSPPPPPSYPQLSFRSKDPECEMQANTPKAIPFKNDLFEGKLLLMLVDKARGDEGKDGRKPYADHFAGKQRIFEVQVQGRFLRQPRGQLWLGGEIGDKMNLGWGLKAFCGVLLGVIRKIGKGNIHHSFGDKNEKPCIVSTWYHFVDRLIVTPAGEEVPEIGGDDELDEDNATRKARKKAKVVPPIDTSATYTFSVYTKYVDLLHWEVCGLPGLSNFNLHKFWGVQPLTFVCYDLPEGGDKKPQHPTEDKGYFFQFEWAHDVLKDALLQQAK